MRGFSAWALNQHWCCDCHLVICHLLWMDAVPSCGVWCRCKGRLLRVQLRMDVLEAVLAHALSVAARKYAYILRMFSKCSWLCYRDQLSMAELLVLWNRIIAFPLASYLSIGTKRLSIYCIHFTVKLYHVTQYACRAKQCSMCIIYFSLWICVLLLSLWLV